MRKTRTTALIPREFFLTSGRGTSPISPENAYDMALREAGIDRYNLLPVSSVIPPKCRERRWKKLNVGALAPVVMAKALGNPGETIGAGLAWGWEEEGQMGLVIGVQGHYDRRALNMALEARIRGMAEARGLKIEKVKKRFEVMKVPEGKFGCVLVALVFVL